MTALSLGQALGLHPLDRVLVNTQRTLREARTPHPSRQDLPLELPYWFFQFVRDDGLLCLRSPGGYADYVSPLDICDVIRSEPVKVRAMPLAIWLQRQRLPPQERPNAPGDQCYASASVLYASKDRWGHCAYYVLFDNPHWNSPNDGRTRWAPIHDDDRREVERRTRRTLMPVVAPVGHLANWSADQGVARAEAKTAQTAQRFVRAALSGDTAQAQKLAALHAKG